ncbi:MAG: hypothetical protein MZV70_52860 [Desulfobacterales bacterium]|nr:hypothetical protein [Desulfobacterales bacterium]
MLTTWDQRDAARGHQGDAAAVPRARRRQDFLYNMFEKAITPRTKVFHFTPHHEPDRPSSSRCSGSRAWPARRAS